MPTIAPPEAPAGAFAAARSRVRRRAPRTLGFMAALCLAIALLLWAFDGGSIGAKLVYSFAIGFACYAVLEAARLAQALLVDGWRRARGQALDAAGFGTGWRGVLPALAVMVAAGPLLGGSLADALTDVARAGTVALSLDIRLRVQESFQAVLSAKQIFQAAAQADRRAQTHLELAEAGVRSGMRPPIERTRAQAEALDEMLNSKSEPITAMLACGIDATTPSAGPA